jgi:hypothetical protein
VSEYILFVFISIINQWFSKWVIWPPRGHTKFLRGHRRMMKI